MPPLDTREKRCQIVEILHPPDRQTDQLREWPVPRVGLEVKPGPWSVAKSKSQTPKSQHQRSFKHPYRNGRRLWSLVLGISFGVWCLGFGVFFPPLDDNQRHAYCDDN